MASAECENCGHEWKLQKRLSDYAGSGPSCPDCGSTRVSATGREQSTREGGQAPRSAEANRGRANESAPATRQQGGAAGGQPATQGQQGQRGEAIAQGALALTSEELSPSERAQAFQSVAGAALEGLTRFQQYREQIDKKQEEHAKNAGLEKATDKPRCVECDHVFSKIPAGKQRVQCPECGEEYTVVNESNE